MSILNKMLEAVEALLSWSMEERSDPDEAFAQSTDAFEVTVREGREQVAAFAAAIHLQREELTQLQEEAARSARPSDALLSRIGEKQRDIAEKRDTYETLRASLQRLEEQLEAARQKQEALRTARFLKGGLGDG